MGTTVTSKGQVTIPKAVREFLGIGPGSKVEFRRAGDGKVIVVPLGKSRPASRFEQLRGHAGAGMTTDEILALTRSDD